MRKLIVFVFVLITGCISSYDAVFHEQEVKDFWLNWSYDSTNQQLLLSTDEDVQGGKILIERTVYSVSYNDSFLLVMQYPDKLNEISKKLFNRDSITGLFWLEKPNDSVWLSTEDSI